MDLVCLRSVCIVLGCSLGVPNFAAAEQPDFEVEQRRAPRVIAARARHEAALRGRLRELGVSYPPRALLLRSFKRERELEVWVGDSPQQPLVLLQRYAVCASSGDLGPKRQEGDLQVPEGVYRVDRYNAWSSFHLSLGLSYPNRSDRIRGRQPLGGDIFIHGGCVTIGCIPIEDEGIESLYILALDAKLRGATPIVHAFPARWTEDEMEQHATRASAPDTTRELWRELHQIRTAFDLDHILPQVEIARQGGYVLRSVHP